MPLTCAYVVSADVTALCFKAAVTSPKLKFTAHFVK